MKTIYYSRKKKITTWIILITVICAAALLLFAGIYRMQNGTMYFIQKLDSGINLGNTLDAYGLRKYEPDAADTDYETFWGNPRIDEGQFSAIREAGFKSVRIPVTWEDHIGADGKISEAWMGRVKEVVDLALSQDLYVILNTHHEKWLDLKEDREDEIAAEFSGVWSQIADCFAGYDERLLFEGFNEPRLRDSEHEWDAGTPELRAMVNRLNREFVDTVRAAGGKNEKRYLLISPYASNSDREAMEALEVPDGRIIVSIHLYLPYDFCQNEAGTDLWDDKNPEDTKKIEEAFSDIDQVFLQKKVPVMITEFGCMDKNNQKSREAWVSFFKKTASQYQVPCMWWDNGSSYRILDREKKEWVYPGIKELLVQDRGSF